MNLGGLPLPQQQQQQHPGRRHQGLDVNGVWIEFPFEPYECQVAADPSWMDAH